MMSPGWRISAPGPGSLTKPINRTLPAALRPSLRLSRLPPRPRSYHRVSAFGGDPYEPLEKAINLINKILTVGASKEGKAQASGGGSKRERWVQFGATASARLPLSDLVPPGAAPDREAIGALLEEYLALPAEEYSLLDPKWVSRDVGDGGSTFRVAVPLRDMLGVDLTPEVTIEARPNPRRGQVTLLGSRAALGSPGLDSMFKLNLVAVLGRRRRRRGGVTLPDHLPGRPVHRLRQWAARARGEAPAEAAAAAATAEAPFPTEKVYTSRDGDLDDDEDVYFEDESEEGEISASDEEAIAAAVAAADAAALASESGFSDEGSSTTAIEIASQSRSTSEEDEAAKAAAAPLLDCRVEVALEVKVPTPLRVVPNALLGAAGSLLSRTVLKAVLPNFLGLLAADFKDWAGGGQRRRGGDATGGGLFAVPQDGAVDGQEGPVVHDVEVVNAAGAAAEV